MTDDLIERLRAESKIWPRSDISGLLNEAAEALAAVREDSARYQWLRDGGLGDLPYDDHGCGPEYPHHEELDAAIDAARGE